MDEAAGVWLTLLGPLPAPPTTPESYTTVEPLRIWNWYDGVKSANLPVAFEAVRTTTSAGCAPLTGETGEGPVALSVEPSAAASGAGTGAEPGETGDVLSPQPKVRATAATDIARRANAMRCGR